FSQRVETLRADARRRCQDATRPPPAPPPPSPPPPSPPPGQVQVQPGTYRFIRSYERAPSGSFALCSSPVIVTVTADGSIEWDIEDATMTSNWKGRINLTTGDVQIALGGVITKGKASLQNLAIRGRASGNFRDEIDFVFDSCGEGRMKLVNRIR